MSKSRYQLNSQGSANEWFGITHEKKSTDQKQNEKGETTQTHHSSTHQRQEKGYNYQNRFGSRRLKVMVRLVFTQHTRHRRHTKHTQHTHHKQHALHTKRPQHTRHARHTRNIQHTQHTQHTRYTRHTRHPQHTWPHSAHDAQLCSRRCVHGHQASPRKPAVVVFPFAAAG